MIRDVRAAATALAVIVWLSLPLPATASVPRFAPILPKAPQALLLDITRAGERLVAVGERGIVVFSDDAGSHWTQARVPTTQMLTSVCFANPHSGWAVGHDGLILHSGDGGATWQLQRDGLAVQRRRNDIRLKQARMAVAGLVAALAKAPQTDSSALHTQLEQARADLDDARAAVAEPLFAPPLLAVACTDAAHAWAVGAYGTYAVTTDGTHWTETRGRIDNPDELHYNAVVATADGRVFIAGEAGTLYRSVDGGKTFTTVSSPYEGSWFGVIDQHDPDSLLVFGLRGHLFRSGDFGDHWLAVDTGADASLAGGSMAGTQILLVGNVGVMLYSSDGGRSFARRYSSERVGLSAAVHVGGSDWITVGEGGIHHVSFEHTEPTAIRSNAEPEP